MSTNGKVCGVATIVKYRSELQSPSWKCCREIIVSILSQCDEDMNKDDAAKEYSTGFVCRLCEEQLRNWLCWDQCCRDISRLTIYRDLNAINDLSRLMMLSIAIKVCGR